MWNQPQHQHQLQHQPQNQHQHQYQPPIQHHQPPLPHSVSAEIQIGEVAVAIDKDKGSQYALKWAVDNVLSKGQTVTLLHVKQRQNTNHSTLNSAAPLSDINEEAARSVRYYAEAQAREIFLPFRCFCSRKDVICNEIILEDVDISKALIDYCQHHTIDVMVVSASSRNQLIRRLKGPDVATNLFKGLPEFCSVYVISKGKMLHSRSAAHPLRRPSSARSPPHRHIIPTGIPTFDSPMRSSGVGGSVGGGSIGGSLIPRDRERSPFNSTRLVEDMDSIRSPFTRGRATNGRAYGEIGVPDSDISFVNHPSPWQTNDHRVSLDRPSFDIMEVRHGPRFSNGSDLDRMSIGSSLHDRRSIDQNAIVEYSSSNCSGFSANSEDFESEMRRLRLELKQTMEMYNAACKEALTAKQKASELQRSRMEEDHRLEEALFAEETARAIAEQEKAKCRAAIEATEAAQRLAELESQKRELAEKKAIKETEEKQKALQALNQNDIRYRKYSIAEIESATCFFSESLKIGEGGYGPVYKSTLDHTLVAIKVLRPDAAQGEAQFQQEVEILSCIRHPNMVLLLGACPEYGCLVYEFMSNGSLEDRLFCRENSPPLSWQLRFRIAAEIGTALLFLHQTKPEPLVHRDLKPANILLDRNYVSKIGDVGLARLVPPSIADTVTQYRMTQAAGTFCYIDPEYQQTGMLGTKSDIYSLGILYLQLITAKPAMGLTHHVQRAIERGTFAELLDENVHDWPFQEALQFAKLSLHCAELRRKDRPDLTQILPELNKYREFGEANMPSYMYPPVPTNTPYRPSQVTTHNYSLNSENHSTASVLSSNRSHSSSSGATL
ncbi:U-box domain-containing protein 35 isoform X2 [Spinacia oleracea]|uniref:RING-type E3 ubiquitin transferase n=1 Tax=Spinacia oleracea TaxID=3562 RepID=A0ABM3RNS0_SPIOL|nr:U-box domain-containing protein 35-like isoform X2 [Spinacia oleracea]